MTIEESLKKGLITKIGYEEFTKMAADLEEAKDKKLSIIQVLNS